MIIMMMMITIIIIIVILTAITIIVIIIMMMQCTRPQPRAPSESLEMHLLTQTFTHWLGYIRKGRLITAYFCTLCRERERDAIAGIQTYTHSDSNRQAETKEKVAGRESSR